MNVLVIPDIHLKTWLFDKAEVILKEGKADMAVYIVLIMCCFLMEALLQNM